MTDTPKFTEPPTEPPANETEAMREEARQRAVECSGEIEDVLRRFQCRIQPMLTSEPVGTGPGMKMLLGATYGILPEIVE